MAVAFPIPDPAPVIIATLFSNNRPGSKPFSVGESLDATKWAVSRFTLHSAFCDCVLVSDIFRKRKHKTATWGVFCFGCLCCVWWGGLTFTCNDAMMQSKGPAKLSFFISFQKAFPPPHAHVCACLWLCINWMMAIDATLRFFSLKESPFLRWEPHLFTQFSSPPPCFSPPLKLIATGLLGCPTLRMSYLVILVSWFILGY